MNQGSNKKYPVFVMCGSDPSRRKLLQVLDPEEKYKSKALLPFLGRRVIDWQLEALRHSPFVENLYLIGLTKEDAPFDFPVHYVPSSTTADVPDTPLYRNAAPLSSSSAEPSQPRPRPHPGGPDSVGVGELAALRGAIERGSQR